jgi:hypothetical protein
MCCSAVKGRRQIGMLRQIEQMQLRHGLIYSDPTQGIELMDSSDQIPPPVKSVNGGYILQAAFEGGLVEDINQRPS